MAGPPIPAITKRAPTIDFIDQRLPKYHPLFASQTVQYDPMSKQYVPNGQALGANLSTSLVSTGASNALSNSNSPVPRPEWRDTNAMDYWISIFPESMSRFKSMPAPKGRSNTLYDIRDKADWHLVYDTLDLARQKYQRSGGPVGWIRKVRRKVADNITPGAEAAKKVSKIVPQDNIATPVVGAVEVLLDAVKTSATVRNQVLAGFDGLIPIFSDVEFFLGTFPGDPGIRNAAIDLTVAVLNSVERAIGFFTSNEFVRGGKAFLSGGDYEKGLLETLDMIQTKSRDLMQQALKSHIHEFHMYSQETRKLHAQLDSKIDTVVVGTNSIEQLLKDHLQQKDRELEAARQENIFLRVENGILRSTSPTQSSMWLPPPQPTHRPAEGWYISQETLRQMIDTFNVDFADVAFVQDKKGQLPSKERSRAEQIINTPPFRNWIVSASSAKLLIHWDRHLPKTVAQVSPLSVFCMTMAQSLRTKDRFLSALWFCGQHIDIIEPDARTGGRNMISSLVDQLLRQFQFDTGPLHNDIDLESLQEGNIAALTDLLTYLVRQLPPALTLFFIIDDAVLFERNDVKDAIPAFLCLIQLATDTNMMASVKLLITSTPGTDFVRGAFEQEDLILNVDSLPTLAAASEERMVRELEGELVENAD